MGILHRKLHSDRGETLVETLASVLIVALTSVIFASTTIAASHMNATAKTADDTFYAELSAAETHTGSMPDTVTVSWSGGAQDFTVTRVGTDSELRSYTYTGGGG